MKIKLSDIRKNVVSDIHKNVVSDIGKNVVSDILTSRDCHTNLNENKLHSGESCVTLS